MKTPYPIRMESSVYAELQYLKGVYKKISMERLGGIDGPRKRHLRWEIYKRPQDSRITARTFGTAMANAGVQGFCLTMSDGRNQKRIA